MFNVTEFFEQLTAKLTESGDAPPVKSEAELPEAVQKAIDDIGNMAQAMESLRTSVNEQKATLEQVTEALGKTLDRVASLETGTAVRKSLDGGELGEDGKPKPPALSDAVMKALNGHRVHLR